MECKRCKYWSEESDIPSTGLCRRYAPRPIAGHPIEGPESSDAIWPRTKPEEWCGEWHAKPEV
jgi:hypothetical protein